MTGEYVVYNDKPKPILTIAKSLELQRWIIDPTSVPYDFSQNNAENRLIARSAAGSNNSEHKSVVQKQMELQKMILGDI